MFSLSLHLNKSISIHYTALRMIEKNNFDGWALLAVGEEALVEQEQGTINGNTSLEVENEINLVEVEEDQVERTREKWILVARGGAGKESWENRDSQTRRRRCVSLNDDDWTPLVQGSEMAVDNVFNDLLKLKTWAHELKIHEQKGENEGLFLVSL